MSASEKHRAAAEEIADTAPFLEDMIDVDEAAKILARHFPDDETGGRVSPTGDEGGSCEPFLHSAAPSPGEIARRAADDWFGKCYRREHLARAFEAVSKEAVRAFAERVAGFLENRARDTRDALRIGNARELETAARIIREEAERG